MSWGRPRGGTGWGSGAWLKLVPSQVVFFRGDSALLLKTFGRLDQTHTAHVGQPPSTPGLWAVIASTGSLTVTPG